MVIFCDIRFKSKTNRYTQTHKCMNKARILLETKKNTQTNANYD